MDHPKVATMTDPAIAKAFADGFREGAARECARLKAILTCEHAKEHRAAAFDFAFNTRMTAEHAIENLETVAQGARIDEPYNAQELPPAGASRAVH